MVSSIRVQECNKSPVKPDGEFVLYWMVANRRTSWNLSLERAIEWAADLRKPLVVLEALRCDYPWACSRFHRFILDGMLANDNALTGEDVLYYPYVEPEKGAGKGLIETLARISCVIVTDDFPCFFIPDMLAAVAGRADIKCEKVDSNGLFPMRAADRAFARAYDFRRFLQKNLPLHLGKFINSHPFANVSLPLLSALPPSIEKRWPRATVALLSGDEVPARMPLDHTVKPLTLRGGSETGTQLLRKFVEQKLKKYIELRNEPEKDATSGLSPYLHFGHISAHQIFREIVQAEDWNLSAHLPSANGSRTGWWGMSPPAEAFLDQVVTWRELGFNMCCQNEDYHRFDSLPAWAQKTLEDHTGDVREYVYSLGDFEGAGTHDELWNAAQRQLIYEGRIHNYLRMLWGKKILEWSESPQAALATMIELNNKYAIDGRNPNSYSGIFWTLGRYDRAWGPERPIFGKIRYMSSDNTARKFRVRTYLKTYAQEQAVT